MLPDSVYNPFVHRDPNPWGLVLPLGGFMAIKDFTAEQVEVILSALGMYCNSMERRISAEQDVEARSIWQKKLDKAQVLQAKIRTV